VRPTVFVVAAVAVAVSTWFGPSTGGQPASTGGRVALVGATIYTNPNDPPLQNGVIVIHGKAIAAVGTRRSTPIPRGAEVVNCAGLTITAGFWNSHVHFLQRKWSDAATLSASELGRQLEEMLTRYGFTTVFDTWSMWENTRRLRDRIEAGEVPGPRIYSTGDAIFPRGAAPPQDAAQAAQLASWGALGFMPLQAFQIARVGDAAEGVAAATRLIDAGTDGVKLYAVTVGRNGLVMPESASQAIVKEAHRKGKPVFAHPTTEAGLLASVRAAVDVLAHTTPQSGAWSPGTLAAMTQARVALIPTLSLWRYELRHERTSLAEGFEETAVGQLRAWIGAGGEVLFGTDVGYMTHYDPTEEFVLMAKAGMTFPQILASLTTTPAGRFGASKGTGRIAPGLAADLAVLRQDPLENIRALAAVQYTVREGKSIFRAAR
jgi:imidazolonepropionase-like amidohydrolase